MQGFQKVVGHQEIITHLQNAISMNKVSHAYLFGGESGSGKKMMASLFAMTLQCERGGAEPCNECHSCRQALSGNHPDIIRVVHEKPNTISVEEVRVQINNDIMIRPYNGKYKIYIVPDADMMTVQAQNALLKTIEEPPEYAVIFLLTENAESLLPTILSRCVMLKIKNVKDALIKKYLMEQMQVSKEECLYIGDSEVDAATGKNAGLKTIGVLWGFRDRKTLETAGADHLIERPEELLQFV